MSNSTAVHPNKNSDKPRLDHSGYKRMIVVFAFIFILAILLFTAAGTLSWAAAWLYTGLYWITLLTVGIWVARRDPELINERGRKSDQTKPFDKVIGILYFPLPFIMPIVAGLDYRYDWSQMAAYWQVIGFIGLIPGLLLPFWAMSANKFLVTTVRIQKEREHQVADTGPYKFVRHPMYVGTILLSLCGPLALGSWWALILGGLTAALFIIRTILEDKILQAELPGYEEYAQRVRYRLVPGLW